MNNRRRAFGNCFRIVLLLILAFDCVAQSTLDIDPFVEPGWITDGNRGQASGPTILGGTRLLALGAIGPLITGDIGGGKLIYNSTYTDVNSVELTYFPMASLGNASDRAFALDVVHATGLWGVQIVATSSTAFGFAFGSFSSPGGVTVPFSRFTNNFDFNNVEKLELMIRSESGGGTFEVDSFYVVPEPSTFVLLILFGTVFLSPTLPSQRNDFSARMGRRTGRERRMN